MTLTSASLAEVEPAVAGAASGLVNVSQQIGAAVGLAVLVTVFRARAAQAHLAPGSPSAVGVVHALDTVFIVAALFAVAALATVLAGVRRPAFGDGERTAPTPAGAACKDALTLEALDL